MGVFPSVVLLVVGSGVALVQTVLGRGHPGLDRSDDAGTELRSAYASGDLSEREFETRLARLRRDDERR